MTIILDCLILHEAFVEHRQQALGLRLFSCSTKTSSLPAAWLFFSTAMPFLYYSFLKGYTMEGSA